MEPKKNPPYQLEKHRPLFFTIGLVIGLLCVVLAFEWKAPYDPIDIRASEDPFEEVEIILPTRFPEPKPPQPKKTTLPQPTYEISTHEIQTSDHQVPVLLEEPLDIPVSTVLPPDDTDKTFIVVESMPSFPGGWQSFYEYVGKQINYPKKAKRTNVEGQVILEFVIDTNGEVSDIKVLKGIGFGCDEEAIRVLENAPHFTPGKQRGKPVRVRQTLPIFFRLH